MDPETPPQEETPVLSKAERKLERRTAKEREREAAAAKAGRSRFLKQAVLWAIPLVLVGLFAWKVVSSPSTPENQIVARDGVHWHTKLAITIKGESIEIPANIGIPSGVVHPENMHTHEADNVLHIEKAGIVTYEDLRLYHFFDIWEKQFTSECILLHCNGEEGSVKMVVNGQENTDFENYVQRDGDKIEIRFE